LISNGHLYRSADLRRTALVLRPGRGRDASILLRHVNLGKDSRQKALSGLHECEAEPSRAIPASPGAGSEGFAAVAGLTRSRNDWNRTYSPGITKMPRKLAAIIPPNTAVPTARTVAAPAPLHHSRSGRRVWGCLHPTSSCHGHPGSTDLGSVALAERTCGEADRLDPTGMS
jgi:hypothetical protein